MEEVAGLYKLAILLLTLLLLASGCAVGLPPDEQPPQFCAVVNNEEIAYEIYEHYFNQFFNDYFNAYYDSHLEYYDLDLLDEEAARETLARLERYAWETTLQAALLRQLARDDYGIELSETYLTELLEPGYAENIQLNRYYLALYPILAEEARAVKRRATEDDISAYIQARLAEKEAEASVECLVVFRYTQP